jgi:hypothetical protein
MRKYIYSPHHLGLVLAPLMTEPNYYDYLNKITFAQAEEAYNTWLSSPPIAKVPDEHKEWFSVERDESEFEVRHQIFSREGKWLDCPKEVYERHSGLLQRETRLVAIPKAEESKADDVIRKAWTELKSSVVEMLSDGDDLDVPYLITGSKSFTKRELALEVTNCTDQGIHVLKMLFSLTIDLVKRGKKKLEESKEPDHIADVGKMVESKEQEDSPIDWEAIEERFRDHAKEHLHFTECDGRYKAGYGDAIDFAFQWFKKRITL